MIQKGSIVRVEFTGKLVSTGQVFDTTDKEEAVKAGIFSTENKYGPVLLAVGAKQVLPGLDEEIQSVEVGVERVASIPPVKAFGDRRADLVRLVSIEQFKRQGIEPSPGMQVEIDGATCRVQSVSGGRVRVDFNHPLAGQAVEYKFKVLEEVKGTEQQVKALAAELLKGVSVELNGDTVVVSVGSESVQNREFIPGKLRFISSMFAFVNGVKHVKFNETYSKPALDSAGK